MNDHELETSIQATLNDIFHHGSSYTKLLQSQNKKGKSYISVHTCIYIAWKHQATGLQQVGGEISSLDFRCYSILGIRIGRGSTNLTDTS